MSGTDNAVYARREGQVLVLTLDSPQRRNAFTPSMRRQLASLIEDSFNDDSIALILLRGAGEHFCAGADLTALERGDPISTIRSGERVRDAQRLIRAIALGPKLVIAAVEGVAYGAGFSIAAACDIVVAAEDARFGLVFTMLGLTAELGLFYTLQQRVGPQVARRMIYLSERLDGARAFEIGLADRLAKSGTTYQVALEIASSLEAAAPLALTMTKRAFSGRIESIEDSFRLELDMIPLLAASDDFQEAVSAFKENRSPRFKGR